MCDNCEPEEPNHLPKGDHELNLMSIRGHQRNGSARCGCKSNCCHSAADSVEDGVPVDTVDYDLDGGCCGEDHSNADPDHLPSDQS